MVLDGSFTQVFPLQVQGLGKGRWKGLGCFSPNALTSFCLLVEQTRGEAWLSVLPYFERCLVQCFCIGGQWLGIQDHPWLGPSLVSQEQ